MSASIVLVRHGETALNRKGASGGESAERIRGWVNVPLDAEGKRQAADIAQTIATHHKPALIYSSDLERAEETAQRIGAASGARVVVTHALRPWNLGSWAGQRVEDVREEMQAHVDNPILRVPGGEPFRRFVRRYLDCLRRLIREANMLDDRICAVTHTRCLQLTRAWVAAGSRGDEYDPAVMNDYGSEVGTGGTLLLGLPK